MKICFALVAATALIAYSELAKAQEQLSTNPLGVNSNGAKILRRVIKSTPNAKTLGKIRTVTVRSANENGAVIEISPSEAHSFGKRSAALEQQQGVKQASSSSSSSTSPKPNQTSSTTPVPPQPTTTTTTTTTSSTTTSPPTPTTSAQTTTTTSEALRSQEELKRKASERQQLAPQNGKEELSNLEILDTIIREPSWQMMTAVEAPQAVLLSSSSFGHQQNDLIASSSNSFNNNQEEHEVLRTAIKGKQNHQNKQAFFYPVQKQQQAQRKSSSYTSPGKTSSNYATKTHWYKQSTTTTQAPRPAPIIQQQHIEQQQIEQQTEYGAAPVGLAEPFAFDFKTEDTSGNGQYRKEESDKDGTVRGSYGYTDANGMYRHVSYVADSNGFRADIKSNEPGLNADETQPATIQYAAGTSGDTRKPKAIPTPAPPSASASNIERQNQEWNNNRNDDAELAALMSREFESIHRP